MERLIEFTANHPILMGAAIALTLATIVFEMKQLGDGATGLQPADAVRLINAGAPIYDLRPAEVYATGHIVGATHWSVDNLDDQLQKLQKKFKNKPLVMCDDRGEVAGRIIDRLRKAGIEKSFHLRGGMQAWLQENLPTTKD